MASLSSKASKSAKGARAGGKTQLFARIAARLDQAALEAKGIPPLGSELPHDVNTAYAVQKQLVKLRIARGERQVGVKMGFTSLAIRTQLNIPGMAWGRLTDAMVVEDGGSISRARYIHPRVEPEIAFLLKRDLAGVVTPLQALAAVEAIAPALEIVDSRYAEGKFSLTEAIADNISAVGFVNGPWHRPDIDITNLGVVLSFNGKPVQVGSTAAILGDPLRSLVAAARFAGEAGEPLRAGWVVMAGSATAAQALPADTWVEIEMQHLGRAAFAVKP